MTRDQVEALLAKAAPQDRQAQDNVWYNLASPPNSYHYVAVEYSPNGIVIELTGNPLSVDGRVIDTYQDLDPVATLAKILGPAKGKSKMCEAIYPQQGLSLEKCEVGLWFVLAQPKT